MKVKGKCICGEDGEVYLDPVDMNKIKNGDKVWVEVSHPYSTLDIAINGRVVAHFPQEPKKAEIPEKIDMIPVDNIHSCTADAIKTLVDKTNQLIDVIKEMKEER
jgi:hypothetical protein